MYKVTCCKFNKESDADYIEFADPEGFLKKVFDPKGYHPNQYNLLRSGCVKYMGWRYDFRAYLTQYIIKTQYAIEEVYAPNKTTLRKIYQGMGKGKIIYITKAPKQ